MSAFIILKLYFKLVAFCGMLTHCSRFMSDEYHYANIRLKRKLQLSESPEMTACCIRILVTIKATV